MSDQYFPSSPAEKAYFDNLWMAAHQGADVTAELSGQEAVAFFQKSKIDKGLANMILPLSSMYIIDSLYFL
jgi:hypothetical protein